MKRCGDANPNGGIQFFFKGGCKNHLKAKDSYKCLGCDGEFHRDCLFTHFELEENQDYSRYALKQIEKIIKEAQKKAGPGARPIALISRIKKEVKKGLERKPAGKSFGFPFMNTK